MFQEVRQAALVRERYDLVVLDIELGRERHAGVAIINTINKLHQGTPVLVVTFIAMLELSRERLLEITQAEAFAPIYVRLAYTPT